MLYVDINKLNLLLETQKDLDQFPEGRLQPWQYFHKSKFQGFLKLSDSRLKNNSKTGELES